MSTETLPTLAELISRTSEINSPPLIYNRLNEAINHPRTSVGDIARIISEDPGLTTRVLKLANSPLYGSRQVDSINRAITLIGTKEIRDISLCVSMICSFSTIPKEFFCLHNHWRHSIACGVLAKNIAIFQREPSADRFFVAGILHDIGQAALCATIPQILENIIAITDHENTVLNEIETRELGYDHAIFGAELLKNWNIPLNIHELVRFHHSPSQSDSHGRDATIIHLADIIAQAFGYGSNAEKRVARLDSEAFEKLELSSDQCEMVISQSEQQIDDIIAILTAEL
ncbi:MAG: HDOD domain-containing protein [Desulfuromonadales bacterium]|nr:HDOD domain-containing protein [Desulfuromonadales bacterium]MBN2791573.1 HDOD domain-containing protein [Desulfuromonadales bacterium]